MTHSRAMIRLGRLLARSPVVNCTPSDRIVIFSDLHLGDGGSRDESLHNRHLLATVLARHYLPHGFKLVLNGDVEDLHRFSLRSIADHQGELYGLFKQFQRARGFYKVVGNHDLELLDRRVDAGGFTTHPALRLQFGSHEMFVLHGHQADVFTPRFNGVYRVLVRHVVRPLGFRNGSVAYDEMKKYRTEQRIYDFALANKIVAVIGHTHRPLFESLSRIDYLKFQIEALCRSYPSAREPHRFALEKKVRLYQQELFHTLQKNPRHGSRSSLYNSGRLVPCVFNSGCTTGKRGITAIEIAGGRMSLVFWFDAQRTTKYFNFNGYQPEPLSGSTYFRVPLKEDALNYIFARITLLA